MKEEVSSDSCGYHLCLAVHDGAVVTRHTLLGLLIQHHQVGGWRNADDFLYQLVSLLLQTCNV